ncbi:hypothetical protein HETIRDRAFT_173930 [Heterobasidion irregulare TC 32-1]|uniref:Uncharacterized protein n=1 Tax=Heterobasidion irregulare (strain TC 32-1) TaxID=747525 RepID=W4JVC1_HETIT|nr:uncharacterized protein HETIRDRAFT_173930 [Heterobasidion irregulare TC 32-1]ETW77429.1 hypothetical protein HETIRDRAFT_173930 [Heterobasidion irregulare TC 32-1]
MKSNPRLLVYPVLDEAWADRECAEPLCTPWDVAGRVLDILSCLVPVEMTRGEWEWTPAKIVNDVADLMKPLMVNFFEGTRAAKKYWRVGEKCSSETWAACL